MNDVRSWAEGWLTNLVAHGVPDAPDLSRNLLLHGRHWSLLSLGEVHEQRHELRRPVADGVPKNGRYGVVYERAWQGRDAVWIEVAEYHHGRFGDRVAMVQPVRRHGAGAMVAEGEPVPVADGEVPPFTPLERARASLPPWLDGTRTSLVLASVVGVLLLGLLAAVSLSRYDGDGVAVAAPDRDVSAATPAPAPAGTPVRADAPAAPVPAPADAAREPPAAAPVAEPSPAPAPAAPAPRADGDLGLAVPISRPACDGGYGVMLISSTRPEAYRTEIGAALGRFPGSRYLLASATCPSLRGDVGGRDVYAVYLGPYPTLQAACATRARVGDGSYVRRLDQGGPDRSFGCD